MKLAINLPLIVYWEARGEARGLAESAGIDRELAADILVDFSGAIGVAKPRVPAILAVIGGEMPGPANFALSGSVKDLRLAMETAAEAGIDVPVAAAARGAHEAAVADGWGNRDFPLQAAWRAGKHQRR